MSSAASSELNAFKSSLIHQAEVLKLQDSVLCCLDSPTSYWSLDLENSVFCGCKCPVPECSETALLDAGFSVGHKKVSPALKLSLSDNNMTGGKGSHNKITEKFCLQS